MGGESAADEALDAHPEPATSAASRPNSCVPCRASCAWSNISTQSGAACERDLGGVLRAGRAGRSPWSDIFRLVESQEQVATNLLVRTLAEQALLEDLIEASKPPPGRDRHSACTTCLLRRFVIRRCRGAHASAAASSRACSMRARGHETRCSPKRLLPLRFWSGMATPPSVPLDTRHTLFSVDDPGQSRGGCSCRIRPSTNSPTTLHDRRRYDATQALGSAMREAGIDAFEYVSARDPLQGVNVALFTPEGARNQQTDGLRRMAMRNHGRACEFLSRPGGGIHEVPRAAPSWSTASCHCPPPDRPPMSAATTRHDCCDFHRAWTWRNRRRAAMGPQTPDHCRESGSRVPEHRRVRAACFCDAEGSPIDTGLGALLRRRRTHSRVRTYWNCTVTADPWCMDLLLQRVLALGARSATAGESPARVSERQARPRASGGGRRPHRQRFGPGGARSAEIAAG